MESKVRANFSDINSAKVLADLDKQFFKHIETKIKPLLISIDGKPAFRGAKSPGELAPILDYQLAGSFYQGLTKADIVKRFNDILKRPEFRKLKKAGFVFDESHVDIVQELIHPIIN